MFVYSFIPGKGDSGYEATPKTTTRGIGGEYIGIAFTAGLVPFAITIVVIIIKRLGVGNKIH